MQMVRLVKQNAQYASGLTQEYRIRTSKGYKSISENEVETMNIDNNDGLPDFPHEKVEVDYYLLFFWKHIMEKKSFSIYITLYLRCQSNQNNKIRISLSQLSEECCMTKKTAVYALHGLERLGLLKIIYVRDLKKGNQEKNIYVLRLKTKLLSREQYFSMPLVLQDKHDSYIQGIISKTGLKEIERIYSISDPLPVFHEQN